MKRVMVVILSLLLLSGCKHAQSEFEEYVQSSHGGTTAIATEPTAEFTESIKEIETSEPVETETVQPETTEPIPTVIIAETQETIAEDVGFSFSDISDREFWFGSGAGAWSTILRVNADGSFAGTYQDSDMGYITDEHPNGVHYWCEFSGVFGNPIKIDDYTYFVQVIDLNFEAEPGTEEVRNGVKYIASESYGISDGAVCMIYLPGTPAGILPRDYLSWVGSAWHIWHSEQETLPFYGLFDTSIGCGFSSYRLRMIELSEELGMLQQEENILRSEGYGLEMTNHIYKLWDDKLNEVWLELKSTLDSDAMNKLTGEQLNWIAEKESAIAMEATDIERSEMAVTWTKDRLYQLLDYLR